MNTSDTNRYALLICKTNKQRQALQGLADALVPFTTLLQSHNDKGNDSRPVYEINGAQITIGDLRKARAALEAARPWLKKEEEK